VKKERIKIEGSWDDPNNNIPKLITVRLKVCLLTKFCAIILKGSFSTNPDYENCQGEKVFKIVSWNFI